MCPGQRTKLAGQRGGEHEGVARQLLLQLPLQPSLGFVRLAVGTVSVATGMRNKGPFAAVATIGLHFGTHRAAAGRNGIQRLMLDRRNFALALVQKVGSEGGDDLRKPDHMTLPQVMVMESINLLMRSWALFSVQVVRWV